MALPKRTSISDSVSARVARTLRTSARRSFSAFSLAELIVVIAVLAVLATIGFISLSSYHASALDAKGAANVRSVLTAISAESATYGKSPREYVIHDDQYALSGSAVVVFGGIPSLLIPGPYGAPWTNYSAGNPDYAKLKLDPEKFRVSFHTDAARLFINVFSWLPTVTADTANPNYVLVGATDVTDASTNKPRPLSFVQAAGILSTSAAFVVGDYPAWMEWSVGGLIRDPEDPSSTWALVDGVETWGPAPCESAEVSWYDVPGLASGESATVEKTTGNGIIRATATCSFSKISISAVSAVCDTGYVASNVGTEPSCVADVCGSTVPTNAASTATSQAVSWTWHHSATAGQCTFACVSGYDWDGSACRASCPTPLSVTHSWLPYSFSQTVSIPNGQSTTLTGTHSFGTAPENGTLSASFWFACADGSVTMSAADGPASCQANLTWNGSRTAPACAPDTRSAICGWTVPTNGSTTTAPSYQQTWDGLSAAWLPEESWTVGAAVCWYSCNANYVPSGGSCVWGTQSASCTGLPANAVWNSVSSVTQTWDGSAWAPAAAGTYSATASTTSCVFKCSPNYTWNGVSCQADTKTFSCAAKPATGTSWNTVSSYLQTWNGSAWAPADSATSYSTSASAAACRYQCSSGYGWDGALCQASVWGSCWTATAASYSYPTANWCASGTKTDADVAGTDGAFDWTCSGQYGGTAATCSSPKKLDGVCGSSNGAALASVPSANLCSVGTASAVTGTGPWNWTCAGVNSGTSASCSASKITYVVTWNGNGGTGHTPASQSVAHGSGVGTLPTDPTRAGYAFDGWFTSTGGTTQVTTSSPIITAAVSFYAQWAQNPACGTSNAVATTDPPTANLCSVGTASAVTSTASTFNWTCSNAPATAASCSAPRRFSVTWNGNSWTPSEASRVVTYNTAVWTLPTATRTGYSFNGWFTATNGGTQITTATAITAAVTYYAQWTQLTYAVSGSFGANANGATVSVCGSNVTAATDGSFSRTGIPYGTACNNVAATRTNYSCSTTTNGPASLTAAVTNVAGSCTANTQTHTCAAKPATGTDWNTVSSYIQTWNGSAWAPAATTTAYDATASTTECRYKCSTSYGWDTGTSTCKASVNGACSTTAGACTAGTASWDNGATACGTTRTWSCTGQFGGTTASCSKANSACATTWTNIYAGCASQTADITCPADTACSIAWQTCLRVISYGPGVQCGPPYLWFVKAKCQ